MRCPGSTDKLKKRGRSEKEQDDHKPDGLKKRGRSEQEQGNKLKKRGRSEKEQDDRKPDGLKKRGRSEQEQEDGRLLKKRKIENQSKDGTPVEVQDDGKPKRSEKQNTWLPGLGLHISDKTVLETDGTWLNDRHINAAQKLIHEAFPAIPGLADTLLLSNGMWEFNAENAVQIMHVGGNHWICASTIGYPLALTSTTACTSSYQQMGMTSWLRS